MNFDNDIDRPDRCPVCSTQVEGGGGESPSEHAVCPACGHLLWFVSERKGDVTVVRLIDTTVAVIELLDLLDNAVDDQNLGHLVIDFGNIQQVSSAALGKLVKLKNRAESLRGKLKLSSLHADLRHVFKITTLDRFFEIYDTEEEALASFAVSV